MININNVLKELENVNTKLDKLEVLRLFSIEVRNDTIDEIEQHMLEKRLGVENDIVKNMG